MSAKILLVDDDKYLLAAMNLVLQQKFQVTTAESGEEGLAQLNTNHRFPSCFPTAKCPAWMALNFFPASGNSRPTPFA